MVTKLSYLGLKKEIICDRCNQVIKSTWGYNLCDDCFDMPTDRIRRDDLKHLPIDHKKAKTECSLCGKIYSNSKRKDVCFHCMSTHVDNKHGFSSPYSIGTTWKNHCCSCGGVQLATKVAERQYEYKYFSTGNPNPSDSPFECKGRYNTYKHRVNNCTHDWLNIYSTVVSRKEAIETYNNGLYGFKLLGFDDAEIEYMVSGSTVFWCWKCGNFYDLIPRFHKRLPEKGQELLPE
ncbi:MAG: hypothetical protein M0T74_16525 [Desulfitobacterium hafniense]|nr:hypothetical protein [Desulfitobacterium hafniense]